MPCLCAVFGFWWSGSGRSDDECFSQCIWEDFLKRIGIVVMYVCRCYFSNVIEVPFKCINQKCIYMYYYVLPFLDDLIKNFIMWLLCILILIHKVLLFVESALTTALLFSTLNSLVVWKKTYQRGCNKSKFFATKIEVTLKILKSKDKDSRKSKAFYLFSLSKIE